MRAGALEGKCFPERGQAGCAERRLGGVGGRGELGALQGPRALVKGARALLGILGDGGSTPGEKRPTGEGPQRIGVGSGREWECGRGSAGRLAFVR